MKQELESEFSKTLKKGKYLYTRLRTPNYGFRGVRYPADFVVWFKNGTILVECKERKSLPIAPSDIRQMPFMQEWVGAKYTPAAQYVLLVNSELDSKYYLFSAAQAVHAKERRKSLKESEALFSSEKMQDIINYMEEYFIWQS